MDRFKNILFVVEGEIHDTSLEQAVELAKHNNAALWLIEVVEKPPTWAGTDALRKSWDATFEKYLAGRKSRLDEVASAYQNGIQISTKVVEGKLAKDVIEQVISNQHDLVIKRATSKQPMVTRILGSHDRRLLRLCPCPVLLTKQEVVTGHSYVVAAVDFEDPLDPLKAEANASLNRQIMELAISLVHRGGGRLDVIHVFPLFSVVPAFDGAPSLTEIAALGEAEARKSRYGELMDALLRDAKSWVGAAMYDAVEINTHWFWGEAGTKIPEEAQRLNADILVMGTVARTGVAGFFMGNTAETVLDTIACSVLAVKPDGFASPVKADN